MAIILWVVAGVSAVLAGGLAIELLKPKHVPKGRRRAVLCGLLVLVTVAAVAGQRLLDRPAKEARPIIRGDLPTLIAGRDEKLFAFLDDTGAVAELDLLASDVESVASQPDRDLLAADQVIAGCDPTDPRQAPRCVSIRAVDHDGGPAWSYSRGFWSLRGNFEVTGATMANGGMLIYSLRQVTVVPTA